MDDLGRLLLQSFAAFAGRTALNDSSGTWTYRQLADAATAIERALRGAGLAADEPVIVPVANEARDGAALTGVWLASGVAVPVARNAPARAIDVVRATTGARFCVTNAPRSL